MRLAEFRITTERSIAHAVWTHAVCLFESVVNESWSLVTDVAHGTEARK